LYCLNRILQDASRLVKRRRALRERNGSPANHQVRDLPGISRELIHRHSAAADFAFWFLETLGAISLFILYRFWTTAAVPSRIITVLLALAFVVFLLMIWTANLGGRIRHPEIEAARTTQTVIQGNL
jgi:hypothetical protein